MTKQVNDGTQLIREGKEGLEVSKDEGKTWQPGPEIDQWQKDAKDLLKSHGKEAEGGDKDAKPAEAKGHDPAGKEPTTSAPKTTLPGHR